MEVSRVKVRELLGKLRADKATGVDDRAVPKTAFANPG